MLLSSPEFVQASEGYVLAWQNLRPAPKVTIQFGDGRKLERTLKGSTVLLRCRPDGTVVDAYPGVYTPADFQALWREGDAWQSRSALQIMNWHRGAGQPTPAAASPLTASKAILESPILSSLGKPAPPSGTGLYDLSEEPLRREQVLERIGLPADASPDQIVAADSRRYRELARAQVHRVLGGFSGLPNPDQCMLPLFKEVLKVPIDDPYLGLKNELPGTP